MRKVGALLVAFILGMGTLAKADEGMWLPLLVKRLNYDDMKKLGLQLTPEEIYSVNNASLKDAIVSLGGFCTGEIISSKGLMLTNHHCGYDAISSNSTPENDILTNGFWAKESNQEIPVEGLTASILYRMEDVTDQVLAEVTTDMSMQEREGKISKAVSALQKEATEDGKYRVEIKPFFYGNEYYMFVYNVYKDVRLVGAPPEAVGKYGGDTDNWMWPRHTGDFSMFRIYADENNESAEYSEDNQPLKPKHHLPISIKGVDQGDYAMIMGFPGSTDRYLTSYGVKHAIEKEQPKRVEIRKTKLDIMKKYMDQDQKTRLDYASGYAQVSNYWKYFIGQSKQLKANNVYDKKKKLEDEFEKWVAKDEDRKKLYGNVIKDIKEGNEKVNELWKSGVYTFENAIGSNINLLILQNFLKFSAMAEADPKEDEEKLKELGTSLLPVFKEFYANHNMELEKELYETMLRQYIEEVPEEMMNEYLKELKADNEGKWDKFFSKLFKKSIFFNEEDMMEFLADPDPRLLGDKGYVADIIKAQYMSYVQTNAKVSAAQDQLDNAMRLFVEGLRKMKSDKDFYPNANSTLRLTYGTVGDYKAKDAVFYDYITTLEGVMEKRDETSFEFKVPEKLVELYEKKDYGRWAEDGKLIVNFITNNDITGGNSGSPVINGKGELIGCAFDGNWEAMSGDIFFEDEIQRTINVDIRYILFIIDKYAGAENLIDEMTIVE